MKNQRRLYFLLLTSIILLFSACSKDEPADEKLKIAVLANGLTFEDQSFLQSCKEGVDSAAADFNFEVVYNIDTASDNLQERIAGFGDQSYDLIIAIGFMWNNPVNNVATNYPNSKFVLVDDQLTQSQPNAVSILFDVDEAAYPLGYLSAWWADEHGEGFPAIGSIGAMQIPQIDQFIIPYMNGAKYYEDQSGNYIDCYVAYAGDFFNENYGFETAGFLIEDGVDVIFGVGGEPGKGALVKAKEKGVCAVGVDVDQYYSFPEVSDILLSCAMKGLDNALYSVIKSMVENNFNGGGIYTGNLANEGVGMAPYHNFDAIITDSVKMEIEAIKAGIIDGSIDTGW